MNLPALLVKRGKSAAAGALLAAGFGMLITFTVAGPPLALLSFDLPYLIRPRMEPPSEAVIVYMDEASASVLDQAWTDNATWNRALHAQLVRRLLGCRPRAIVFDVLFDRATPKDGGLVDAVRAARAAGIPVIVGAGPAPLNRSDKVESSSTIIPPIEALAQHTLVGVPEEPIWNSDKPRRHSQGYPGVPSIAVRAAELTAPEKLRELPSERWIQFYGPAAWLNSRSFAAALDPAQIPNSFFTNKVCFIGARPGVPNPTGNPGDAYPIPYTRWDDDKAPGVEITATVYLNLVRQDFLTRLSAPAERALLVTAGLLLGFGLGLLRPTSATLTAAALFAGTFLLAASLMWQQHVWFSWLIIGGVEIPVALVTSVLAGTRLQLRENRVLQQDLARLTATTVPSAQPATVRATSVQAQPAQTSSPPPVAVTTPPLLPDHTLIRCIGKGAYGEVWLARNVIGSFHALKIIRGRDFHDTTPYEREFRGIQRFMPVSRLHPGLVQILHVGRRDDQGFFYYVMEPADDETTGAQIDPAGYSAKTLGQEIRRRGSLPVCECVQLGLQLTAALEFLHLQQLIHRDLKPSNIIYVRGEPKLADIGLVTDIASPTTEQSLVGTPGYIPPEGPGQPTADVFSLGRVLYEACTGRRCSEFPALPDELSNGRDGQYLLDLNQIILKACEEIVTDRYLSAEEMRSDLLQLEVKIRATTS